jgi:hypothetical protein
MSAWGRYVVLSVTSATLRCAALGWLALGWLALGWLAAWSGTLTARVAYGARTSGA